MSALVFVDEFKLIELVESHPALWDSNSVLYRDKNRKLSTWEKIAGELCCTVDVAQVTWKRLRDRFTRNKRQQAPSGSQGGRRKWDKENMLQFLDKVFVTRSTTSNVSCRARQGNSSNKELEESIFLSCAENDTLVEIECLDASVENQLSPSSISAPTEPTIEIPTFEIIRPLDCIDISKPVQPENPTASSSRSSNYLESIEPENVGPKGKKRRKSASVSTDVTTSLISAINKLTDNEIEVNNVTTSAKVTESFIKLYNDQMRHLFANRSETELRRLRNRFMGFMDDLCEEYEL